VANDDLDSVPFDVESLCSVPLRERRVSRAVAFDCDSPVVLFMVQDIPVLPSNSRSKAPIFNIHFDRGHVDVRLHVFPGANENVLI
jgi:hypothetical protein